MKRRSNKVEKTDATKPAGRSAYAKKRASGEQMYGPDCCAHTVTDQQVRKAKAAAIEREREERQHALSPQAGEKTRR